MKKISLYLVPLLMMSFVGALIPYETSSAAVAACEAKYSSAPVASDASKAKAFALLQACKQGWTTDKCTNTPAKDGATQRERKAACEHGKEYRKTTPPPAAADATPTDCKDISTNILKCNANGGDPVTSLLLQIFNFLAVGVGIAVMAGIIWGGMLYASSNGDSNKINQGKMAIVNSIIGLLLFIFMYAIINYIVPGGLFR